MAWPRLKKFFSQFLPSGFSSTRSPATVHRRTYAFGKPGRLTAGFGAATTSEDMELSLSLRTARNRSRELVRDASYAKRAKMIVQNNVVGGGIGLQAKVMTTRNELNERVNDEIEAVWEEWMEAASCHMGQTLHFLDLERQLMGQVFEAGEIFIRMHLVRIGRSRVPLALEIIEPERIADELQSLPVPAVGRVKLGVEVNEYGAPQAYWIRNTHPGDSWLRTETMEKVERVPADDIIHLRTIDRWPQTRAIPWMHASGRKFNDMDGLTEAEITAARGAACYMGFIESPDEPPQEYGELQEDGTQQKELEPAIIERLKAGEKFNFAAPNRPNPQLDPFMRLMLREVAAGVGTSYESLSRDYSQSNYSASRLALLDDRDLWRVLQMWFIRSFRARVHRVWLRQAIMAKALMTIGIEAYAIDPVKYEAARFKPRGWGWIDPTKEVEAYERAIKNGFTTVSAVIAQTGEGRDLEDVLKEREQELRTMAAMDLIFENDPSTVKTADAATPAAATEGTDTTEEDTASEDPSVQDAERLLRKAGRRHAGIRKR